jgi:hypothetical protein
MIEAKAAPAAPAGNPFGDDEEEDEAPATPTKRATPKRATAEVTAKPELKKAMAAWLDDDEDGE